MKRAGRLELTSAGTSEVKLTPGLATMSARVWHRGASASTYGLRHVPAARTSFSPTSSSVLAVAVAVAVAVAGV